MVTYIREYFNNTNQDSHHENTWQKKHYIIPNKTIIEKLLSTKCWILTATSGFWMSVSSSRLWIHRTITGLHRNLPEWTSEHWMEEIVMLNSAVLDLATWWRLSERRSGRVEHHCQLIFETVTITPALKKQKNKKPGTVKTRQNCSHG